MQMRVKNKGAVASDIPCRGYPIKRKSMLQFYCEYYYNIHWKGKKS